MYDILLLHRFYIERVRKKQVTQIYYVFFLSCVNKYFCNKKLSLTVRNDCSIQLESFYPFVFFLPAKYFDIINFARRRKNLTNPASDIPVSFLQVDIKMFIFRTQDL